MNRRRLATSAAILAPLVALALSSAPPAGASPSNPHHRPLLKVHNTPLTHNGTLTGDDGGEGAPDPNLSALCQDLLGQPNSYADPAPNVDQIHGDTTVAAGSQTGCQAAQNETVIAVNPANPNNLVAGANDYRVFNTRENRNDGSGVAYTTFDGGKTWTNVVLPHLTFQTGATGALSDMDSAGDPAIAFGPHNTVYYANLVFSRLNLGSGIVVSISHDGGLTWGEPSVVRLDGVDGQGNPTPTDLSNDKEWISVDQATGRVYVTWTVFGPAGSPIVISSSGDSGATWSDPRTVNPAFTPGGVTPYSQGSVPQVDNAGTLYVAYESAVCQSLNCDQATDHDAIIVARSTDHGQTFSTSEAAFDFDFPYNADVGRSTLTRENWRVNSYPSFSIDPVTSRLYIAWADDRNGQYDANGSVRTNGDVFLISSGNGKNWTGRSLGTAQDEVFPAVAANNGRVAVSYYTRAYDPNGIGVDVAYSSGTGMSAAKLSQVTRITTQTEDPNVQFVGVGFVTGNILQGEFIGDYTGMALGSDLVAHPSWTDFRGRPGVNTPNQDAYTQALSVR